MFKNQLSDWYDNPGYPLLCCMAALLGQYCCIVLRSNCIVILPLCTLTPKLRSYLTVVFEFCVTLAVTCWWAVLGTASVLMIYGVIQGAYYYKRPLIDEPVSWRWDTSVFLSRLRGRRGILGSTLEQSGRQGGSIDGQFAFLSCSSL